VSDLKLTVYFGERDRAGDRYLADALCDVFASHELATSLAMRGTTGYGRSCDSVSSRSVPNVRPRRAA
jgi:PII-like signaling protein